MKTTNTQTLALFELLSSKICHDLISPVGAIHNGLEVIEELGEADETVLEMLNHSSNMASAKLKLFRIAYGAGGANSDIKPQDVHDSVNNMLAGNGKIKQIWQPQDLNLVIMPPAFCKVLACIIMLGIDCLPRGGTISTEKEEENRLSFIFKGDGAKIKDGQKPVLEGSKNIEGLEPSLIHPYMVKLILEEYEYKLSTAESKDTVTLTLRLPE